MARMQFLELTLGPVVGGGQTIADVALTGQKSLRVGWFAWRNGASASGQKTSGHY